MKVPKFEAAKSKGDVINKDGYHQCRNCYCTLTTRKGAYRDVTVEMDNGMTIHFYHQNPVVVKHNGKIIVDSCGFKTKTTKERINQYIPCGYYVRQEDYEWYVEYNDRKVPFEDRMNLGDLE